MDYREQQRECGRWDDPRRRHSHLRGKGASLALNQALVIGMIGARHAESAVVRAYGLGANQSAMRETIVFSGSVTFVEGVIIPS